MNFRVKGTVRRKGCGGAKEVTIVIEESGKRLR